MYSLSLQKNGNCTRETPISYKQHLPWFELNNHQERWCKTPTFLTHRTTKVPVLVHSSSVSCWRSMSSQLFLIRNSSSQKKSLTTSGDASSKIVLLRYCGGPFWNEANTEIKINSKSFHLPSISISSRTDPKKKKIFEGTNKQFTDNYSICKVIQLSLAVGGRRKI